MNPHRMRVLAYGIIAIVCVYSAKRIADSSRPDFVTSSSEGITHYIPDMVDAASIIGLFGLAGSALIAIAIECTVLGVRFPLLEKTTSELK